MSDCDPRDVAIKSFFLGPQSENRDWLKTKWNEILDNWIAWRGSLFPQDGEAISAADRKSPAFRQSLQKLDAAVNEILRDLQDETPKFTPRYLGHMVSEISLPALLGHVCALLHNPNNTSREVSRVTSRLEEEAIADLASMVGFTKAARGHFTSGGTIANFEALWRAIVNFDHQAHADIGLSLLSLGPWNFSREYKRKMDRDFNGPVVLVSHNKHFSWEKAVSLMGLGDEAFWPIALDGEGRLSIPDLRANIEKARAADRSVLMVVSVAGTTEMGEVDPIGLVQDVLEEYRAQGLKIWHHVDAAYGGYYASMLDGGELESKLTQPVAQALRSIRRVDSITLDPHKLGYVPYACGAFVACDMDHYSTRAFSAAYLLSDNESRWTFTLEGSRSGAGVTAAWLANRALGLNERGYGRLLAKGLEARDHILGEMGARLPGFLHVEPADLNILCFCLAPVGAKLSAVNATTRILFKHFEQSPNFSVSKTVLHARSYKTLLERLASGRGISLDEDNWVMLRLVLMNPFIVSKESATDFTTEFINEILAARPNK